ncbi:unnamed protein product [Prunus armeniaca]
MIQADRLYSADDLYMLRQGEDEPFREYATRFSHEYSHCPETDDRAAFGAFKSGLRESNFRYMVHSNPWNTYAELMKQATVHAKVEYCNSKLGPATSACSTFGDLPPASVPTPAHGVVWEAFKREKTMRCYNILISGMNVEKGQ